MKTVTLKRPAPRRMALGLAVLFLALATGDLSGQAITNTLVPVVSRLISAEQKPDFVNEIRAEYDCVRAQHAGQTTTLLGLAEARRRAPACDWPRTDLPQPKFLGPRALDSFPLAELVPFIDWSPLFHTWELRGRYPAILQHEKYGDDARKLFSDAQQLLERMVTGKLVTARAVYGFFPANAIGDDVEIYTRGDW